MIGFNPTDPYNRRQRTSWNYRKIVIGLVVLLVTLGTLVTNCVGCYNPETPAGFEGYVQRGAVFGQTHYYGSQVGPVSTGLGWLLYVENVDTKWQTIDEPFEVQSADNLLLNFKAHITLRPQPGKVKDIVETYGGKDWYKRSIAQPFRNAVYDAVSKEKALDAKDKRNEIAAFINKRVKDLVANKPFQVQQVVVGAINLPKSVADAQNNKVTAETAISQKEFEIKSTQADAIKRIEEAKGIAEAQRIINASLTDKYLQHEAITAQREMANGENHTVVYIPSGSNGIPLVRTVD
jgi:hypothetical protein